MSDLRKPRLIGKSKGGEFEIFDAGSLYNTDGTFPKTDTVVDPGNPNIPTNRFFLDLDNYTAISTPGVVDAAEVQSRTFTIGTNVTALVVTPITPSATPSDLVGVLITVNAASDAAAATAMSVSVAAGGTASQNDSDFCPAGETTILIYDAEITKVHAVAIGNETPNNYTFIKGI